MVNLCNFVEMGNVSRLAVRALDHRSKTGSDVEGRTRNISSIMFTLGKIDCAKKKLFVLRVERKCSPSLTLKIP